MSKAKDAAFYRSLHDHLIKVGSYILVLEKNTNNIQDEFSFIKECLRHIQYKLDSYLNYSQLSNFIKDKEKEDVRNFKL